MHCQEIYQKIQKKYEEIEAILIDAGIDVYDRTPESDEDDDERK